MILKPLYHSVRKAFGKYIKLSAKDLYRVTPLSNCFGFDRGTPVDRYYIEKFLHQNRQYVKGCILEVAEDLSATRFARLNETATEEPTVETLHFNGIGRKVTMIGDLTKPETLPENRYDCFICTKALYK